MQGDLEARRRVVPEQARRPVSMEPEVGLEVREVECVGIVGLTGARIGERAGDPSEVIGTSPFHPAA
jgi:hypothetical protein